MFDIERFMEKAHGNLFEFSTFKRDRKRKLKEAEVNAREFERGGGPGLYFDGLRMLEQRVLAMKLVEILNDYGSFCREYFPAGFEFG